MWLPMAYFENTHHAVQNPAWDKCMHRWFKRLPVEKTLQCQVEWNKVFNDVTNYFYDFISQNLFLVHCQECYEKIGRKAQSWQPTLYTSSSASPVSLNFTLSLFTTRLVPCACRWWNMRWRDMSSGQLNLRRRKIISLVNRNILIFWRN